MMKCLLGTNKKVKEADFENLLSEWLEKVDQYHEFVVRVQALMTEDYGEIKARTMEAFSGCKQRCE